jgi:hypothetical protein
MAGSCNIPANAQAYLLNLTAIPHTTLGSLSVWASGQNQPSVSTLYAPTGVQTSNAAIVAAGDSGAVSVYARDDTDLLLDVNGYFAPPGTGGLRLFALAPCRVVDTSMPPGSPPLYGFTAFNVGASSCLAGRQGAQAFVLNATVAPPAALGYLILWGDTQTIPLVSTLTSLDGAVTSNMAIVPSMYGFIQAFASDPTYLILDISGYFAP